MPSPLLCELHAHSTWSDGALSVPQLVDLYGSAGFDVLAVTDHTLRDESAHIRASEHDAYLAEIEAEAERAVSRYGLVLVPGLELTYDDPEPRRAAHAVAIGLRSFVGTRHGLDQALERAGDEGAALVAAHPYEPLAAATSSRGTARW